MPSDDLARLLSSISATDLRLDEQGRVVIAVPGLEKHLRELGISREKMEPAAGAKDTNFICCGNGTCPSKATDLGSIVERFAGGSL